MPDDPPGVSRAQCDLCHQKNCTYDNATELLSSVTPLLSNVTYDNETLVYKLYGEEPLSNWHFTVVMPTIIASTFILG